jgi:hypothetical protein
MMGADLGAHRCARPDPSISYSWLPITAMLAGERIAKRIRAFGASFPLRLCRCVIYSITTNQEAIRTLFRVMNRYVGNLPPMPGVFPDYPAPLSAPPVTSASSS